MLAAHEAARCRVDFRPAPDSMITTLVTGALALVDEDR